MQHSTRNQVHKLHTSLVRVVLVAYLAHKFATIEGVQCHAVAEASSEPTQGHHQRPPDKRAEVASNQNLRWLVVARQQQQPPPPQEQSREFASIATKTQLDQPPTSTTITPNPPQQHSSALTNHSTTTTASPIQSLIESILINVEVRNLLNERRRERFAEQSRPQDAQKHPDDEEADDEPSANATDSSAPSAWLASPAPTDSGEDLLESLDTTTERGSSAAANLPDSELQLVESNNVSAIVGSAPSSSSHLSSFVAMANSSDGAQKQPISCEKAYTACALREVCAPTLKAYNDDCHDLIYNKTSQCSPKCLKAMIALRSSETGDDLANCDCEGDEYCSQSKARSQLCRREVERAIEPRTVVSCSVASSICMANQLCSAALGYYYRNCQSLFSQRHCTEYCKNSLAVLHRQPQAEKLINCQCDGSEEFPCVRYKTYTEQLCLNRHQQQQTTTPTDGGRKDDSPQTNAAATSQLSSSLSSSQVEDEPTSSSTNEDDKLNLTNDPMDTQPTSHSGSWPFGGGADHDDYEPEYTGVDSDGGETGGALFDGDLANSNNFVNGIQQHQPTIEDNWIPIVSGRYFTNLQQQQSRRQHKVKQQPQRPPKSNPRRTQKNPAGAKQKGKSNEAKRRHSRPYMFALTSSAATLTFPCLNYLLLMLAIVLCVSLSLG